jgi:hypothetical protein
MAKQEYRLGTPSLQEWEGFWRHLEAESPASIEECREATDSLWSHLEKRYRVGSGDWDDLFLRGDFAGDRSQVLELVYPPVLCRGIFQHLGSWIASTNPKWRVIVPTFLGPREAFVIYPEGVRHGSSLSPEPPEGMCAEAARAMLRLHQYAHATERAKEDGWRW